jgi:malate synthase
LAETAFLHVIFPFARRISDADRSADLVLKWRASFFINVHNNMVAGVQILSKVAQKAQTELFSDGALGFLAALHRTFESTRQSLLVARDDAQRRIDSGAPLDFPKETAHIRAEPSWHCVAPAPGLEDRRVEITGPTDRKMVINALNSGAKTFMADFEGNGIWYF